LSITVSKKDRYFFISPIFPSFFLFPFFLPLYFFFSSFLFPLIFLSFFLLPSSFSPSSPSPFYFLSLSSFLHRELLPQSLPLFFSTAGDGSDTEACETAEAAGDGSSTGVHETAEKAMAVAWGHARRSGGVLREAVGDGSGMGAREVAEATGHG
jgi:hypothetical protein